MPTASTELLQATLGTALALEGLVRFAKYQAARGKHFLNMV